MTHVVIAIPEPRATALAEELALEGVDAVAVVPLAELIPVPALADAVIVPATRVALSPDLVAACDRVGARIIALGEADVRLTERYGLRPALRADASGWEVAACLADDRSAPRETPATPHRVIAVWGPQGAPGRSTLAVQLAVELARTGRRTALVDADTVAPALALLLGLSDDAPGIAAACRRGELGALDDAELTRLASVVDTSAGPLEVLGGINRPSRWPELSAARLATALQACRHWAQDTVVDVAAAFDADDEATYDLSGPRRHAATTTALAEADRIIAVTACDPLSISRFLRDHAELRRLAAPTPISVVVNRLRPGPLGLDARGQVRRTLERFAGIADPVFLPDEPRTADAALLHARPMSDVVPRSALVAGIRGLATALAPEATADSSRGSSRASRRLRRAPAARQA
ncbi:AAA family ATPase [Microbacterium sp.]|uniref:AAA family ATPase n=1 Tax=Microbacterium sp. TaxID=51671 RepID=UPI0039E712CA